VNRPEYTIRLLRIAEEDLAEILLYIAADCPSAANRIATKIEKNLKLLLRNPYLGRLPNDRRLMELGYRYLVVDDYLVFYTIEDQDILVHRILHGARDYLLEF
jgi:plasmid stabilization system protein ParE